MTKIITNKIFIKMYIKVYKHMVVTFSDTHVLSQSITLAQQGLKTRCLSDIPNQNRHMTLKIAIFAYTPKIGLLNSLHMRNK